MTDMKKPMIADSTNTVASVAQRSPDDIVCDFVAAKSDIAQMTPRQIAAFTLESRRTLISLGLLSDGTSAPAAEPVAANRDPQFMALPAAERQRLISNSVSDEHVTCLCCGGKFKMLKRHLGAEHNLNEHQYRERFGLEDDHPIVAPSYHKRKSNYARKVGFGKYARNGAEG